MAVAELMPWKYNDAQWVPSVPAARYTKNTMDALAEATKIQHGKLRQLQTRGLLRVSPESAAKHTRYGVVTVDIHALWRQLDGPLTRAVRQLVARQEFTTSVPVSGLVDMMHGPMGMPLHIQIHPTEGEYAGRDVTSGPRTVVATAQRFRSLMTRGIWTDEDKLPKRARGVQDVHKFMLEQRALLNPGLLITVRVLMAEACSQFVFHHFRDSRGAAERARLSLDMQRDVEKCFYSSHHAREFAQNYLFVRPQRQRRYPLDATADNMDVHVIPAPVDLRELKQDTDLQSAIDKQTALEENAKRMELNGDDSREAAVRALRRSLEVDEATKLLQQRRREDIRRRQNAAAPPAPLRMQRNHDVQQEDADQAAMINAYRELHEEDKEEERSVSQSDIRDFMRKRKEDDSRSRDSSASGNHRRRKVVEDIDVPEVVEYNFAGLPLNVSQD